MSWLVGPIGAEDLAEFSRVSYATFGVHPTEAEMREIELFIEADRAWAVRDGGRIVGVAANLSLELTLPGGGTVPTAGVTAVGVLPTHRRRGILKAMMATALDDATARGEPVAALTASESGIYGRFGFGPGVLRQSLSIERAHCRWRRPPTTRGRVTLVAADEMGEVLPRAYEAYRGGQPGEVSRSPSYWEAWLVDPEARREGASARFAAVFLDADDDPQGFVSYRVKGEWADGDAASELIVEELVAATDEARVALWDFVFGVDLVRTVTAVNLPVDEPMGWMLADPRRAKVRYLHDHLWLRLVDVETALSARSYAIDGTLVLEVADELRPGSAVVYELAGGKCRRVEAPAGGPDLSLGAADLGAAYLGGVTFTTLARADRVVERRPGALARADLMFSWPLRPACTTDF